MRKLLKYLIELFQLNLKILKVNFLDFIPVFKEVATAQKAREPTPDQLQEVHWGPVRARLDPQARE